MHASLALGAHLAAATPLEAVYGMSESRSIKPDAKRLVDSLPETATWDDLAYEVYVRQSIDTGLVDADSGRVLEHDEALARIRARIRRAS